MKKIKFLNGLKAMFAFAVVALTGSLFTSCEKEDVNATFQSKPAEAVINVEVREFFTQSVVTNEATITSDKGAVENGKLTLTGNKDLAAQTINFTATYKGNSGTTSVTIPALKAGTVAEFKVTITVAYQEPSEDKTLVIATKLGDPVIKTYNLGDPSHSHADAMWMENANDYILRRTFTYTKRDYSKVIKNELDSRVDFDSSAYTYDNSEDVSVEFKFSAWSLYRVYYFETSTDEIMSFSYKETGEDLGKVTIEKVYGSGASSEEKALPGHSHEYVPGHGHGEHGYDANAGGGIVDPA